MCQPMAKDHRETSLQAKARTERCEKAYWRDAEQVEEQNYEHCIRNTHIPDRLCKHAKGE